MSAERTRLLIAAMEAANFIVSTFIRGPHSETVPFGEQLTSTRETELTPPGNRYYRAHTPPAVVPH